ncbi:cAMP-dependent protein kinase catalytic subunit beta [Trichinella nativa]|uniref:cAMP-dependent protein kinase catalytic subunit beta n=1 Tax=Trichinella nativa TaxID=6335 RepID=A0A0V1KK21_9BILA|nr:cAMP-dependent protein kinase catalytic subunit beta [Trichinella nativa]KRZ47677.1 cAMP-dependent protein kinase catalytic subunit beta [Trichinella nativa]
MCRKFSAPLKNLIKQLLKTDCRKRIGCRGGGAREIKSHAWFNNINQKAILQRRITSPFLPTIKDRDDMNNFDNYEETAISESPENNRQRFALALKLNFELHISLMVQLTPLRLRDHLTPHRPSIKARLLSTLSPSNK